MWDAIRGDRATRVDVAAVSPTRTRCPGPAQGVSLAPEAMCPTVDNATNPRPASRALRRRRAAHCARPRRCPPHAFQNARKSPPRPTPRPCRRFRLPSRHALLLPTAQECGEYSPTRAARRPCSPGRATAGWARAAWRQPWCQQPWERAHQAERPAGARQQDGGRRPSPSLAVAQRMIQLSVHSVGPQPTSRAVPKSKSLTARNDACPDRCRTPKHQPGVPVAHLPTCF